MTIAQVSSGSLPPARPALDAALALSARALRQQSFRDSSPHRDFVVRRVDDRAALPEYPYRDDGLRVASALSRWFRAYLDLYYADDAAVAGDTELQAFVRALSADDGAALSDVPAVDDVAALADLVTTIVFRVTAEHAVINYGGYDYFAWPPTLPTSRWAPRPDLTAPIAAGAYLSSLPPLGLADLTLDLMLPQRELRLNTLGHYPKAHFADPRVAPLLQALLADLAAAEDAIATENAIRRWTSPNLLPSRIAQSIHVQ